MSSRFVAWSSCIMRGRKGASLYFLLHDDDADGDNATLLIHTQIGIKSTRTSGSNFCRRHFRTLSFTNVLKLNCLAAAGLVNNGFAPNCSCGCGGQVGGHDGCTCRTESSLLLGERCPLDCDVALIRLFMVSASDKRQHLSMQQSSQYEYKMTESGMVW